MSGSASTTGESLLASQSRLGPWGASGMRKFALVILGLLLCGSSSWLFAQSRVEAGIFIDYLGISQTSTDNFGVGGRFGYRVHHNVMLEGELAYDYGIDPAPENWTI